MRSLNDLVSRLQVRMVLLTECIFFKQNQKIDKRLSQGKLSLCIPPKLTIFGTLKIQLITVRNIFELCTLTFIQDFELIKSKSLQSFNILLSKVLVLN